MAGAAFVPSLRVWPLFWLAPLFVYGVLIIFIPPLRATFRPWRFGRVSTATILATTIIAVGSSVVLMAFHSFQRPSVDAYGSIFPVFLLGGIVSTGVLFSIFNALFEEMIFRGVLFDAVESEWSGWVAVVVTACLFGYGHMHGYPPGPIGAGLAGFYGICLGWLRLYSQGIGLPVVAHIAADATIFTILVRADVF